MCADTSRVVGNIISENIIQYGFRLMFSPSYWPVGQTPVPKDKKLLTLPWHLTSLRQDHGIRSFGGNEQYHHQSSDW